MTGTEEDAVRDDDGGPAARFQEPEEEGEKEKLGLLGLHDLKQIAGRVLVVQRAGEGGIGEDQAVAFLFAGVILREGVAVADVRVLDAVEKHVHAPDAEHGVIEVEAVEHVVVEVGSRRFAVEDFGVVFAQVLGGGDQVTGGTAGGIADDVRRRRGNHLDHEPDVVARGAELAVLPGRRDLAEHVLVDVALGVAIVDLDLIDEVDDLGEEGRSGDGEAGVPHVVGVGGVGVTEGAQEGKDVRADAELVVTINVRQLLQTPVVKKHALDSIQALLKRNDELRQLLTAAGIDPLKDIDTLTLTTTPVPTAQGRLADLARVLVVVARGRFDSDKAASAATEYAKNHPSRLKKLTEDDVPMWEVTTDDKPCYAAFAGKNTVVMTTSKSDTVAAVRRAGQRTQSVNKNLRAALDKLKGDEPVWMAMVVSDQTRRLLKGDDNSKDFADALQSITGALELTDDAQFTLVVHTSDAKAATQIKGKIDELMPLLAFMAAGKDASGRIVKELINNLKLSAEKNDVSIHLKITDAQIEKARKKSQ